MASPYCPSFAKSLRGNPSIGGILSALGVVAPGAGVAEPGARRPRAERGNLKAPEVTQLNYRLTTKLHKEKIYNAPRLPGAMRSRGSHRALVALSQYVSVQANSEGSRASRLTASPAATGCAPIGNCNTIARWPSHRRVSSTTCPSGNSSGIVMDHSVLHVDLPEAREPLSDFLVGEDADAKHRLALDILVERNLRARQQTDCNMRLPNRGKAARDRIAELGRHQLVLDLGRPGRHIVQTIVTH